MADKVDCSACGVPKTLSHGSEPGSCGSLVLGDQPSEDGTALDPFVGEVDGRVVRSGRWIGGGSGTGKSFSQLG
jgi:hypothetical protein